MRQTTTSMQHYMFCLLVVVVVVKNRYIHFRRHGKVSKPENLYPQESHDPPKYFHPVGSDIRRVTRRTLSKFGFVLPLLLFRKYYYAFRKSMPPIGHKLRERYSEAKHS